MNTEFIDVWLLETFGFHRHICGQINSNPI